ncbi:MAG: hypothetical protein GY797_04610 [Deltaproteobacteria bacterium]|nr:hypothetical protein [Deltaproteobacteria bacterium]
MSESQSNKLLLYYSKSKDLGQIDQADVVDRNTINAAKTKLGLLKIPDDHQKKLFSINNIEASGVPSLFSHAFVFSRKLAHPEPRVSNYPFLQFSTIMKGIYLGIIELEKIELNEHGEADGLGSLGDILQEFGDLDEISILTTIIDGKSLIIGGVYPHYGSLVFPGDNFDDNIRKKVEKKIKKLQEEYDLVKLLGNFMKWVFDVTVLWSVKSRPLWAKKLHEIITNDNSSWNITNIKIPDHVDSQNAILHEVRIETENNPIIKLSAEDIAKLSSEYQVPDSTLTLLDSIKGEKAMTKEEFYNFYDNGGSIQHRPCVLSIARKDIIPFVRYFEEPEDLLICSHHKHTGFRLSNYEKILDLGSGLKITGAEIICGDDCGASEDPRPCPKLKPEGFFEVASEGSSISSYVIWKGFDEITHQLGCDDYEFPDGGKAVLLRFGKMKIRIKGKIVTKSDILCDKIIKFADDKMPDIPIKSEFLDYISEIVDADGRLGLDIKRSSAIYKMKLRGMKDGEFVEWKADDKRDIYVSTQKPTLLLWPNFCAENWKLNYSFFRTPHVDPDFDDGYTLKFISKVGTKRKCIATGRGVSFGLITESHIEHIEILLGVDNPVSMGIFRDPRLPLAKQNLATIPKVNLDYGTSNTKISSTIGGTKTNLYNKLLIYDRTECLLGEGDIPNLDVLWKDSLWFPTFRNFGCKVKKRQVTILPSEIFFKKTIDNIDDGVSRLCDPINKYSIFHPYKDVLDFKFQANAVFDFKWPNEREDSEVDSHREHRKAYIKLVMHLVLASLRSDGYNAIKFTATYPLAFGEINYNAYMDDLHELLTDLNEFTGMSIAMMETAFDVDKNGVVQRDSKHVALIPESHAAKARHITEGHQLVVDIGGGSTDIALYEGNTSKPLLFDSVKYGGRQFVETLVKDPNLIKKFIISKLKDYKEFKKSTNSAIFEKFLAFDQRTKTSFINRIIRAHNGLSIEVQELEDISMRFFCCLLQYLCILLKSKGVTGPLTLFTVGSAWHFVREINILNPIKEYSTDNDWIEEYIVEYLNNNEYCIDNIQLIINPNNSLSQKEVIAVGALELADQGFEDPRIGIPVNSIVGCRVTIGGKEGAVLEENDKIPYNLTQRNLDLNQIHASQVVISKVDFIKAFPWASNCSSKKLEEMRGRFNHIASKNNNFKEATQRDKFGLGRKDWFLVKNLYLLFLETLYSDYFLCYESANI